MKKLLISLAITVIVYFSIALVLTLLPVKRNPPIAGLDFSVLDVATIANIETQTRNFVARDGAQLFYRELVGQSDLVLVLLHGSGTEGRYLIPLAEALNAAHDITVIIPDLRGHGESMLGQPGDVQYIGQLEHDLEDLNLYLRAQYPQAQVYVGGHSSGGGLAVRYGGTTATAFDGYVLLAPYLGHTAPTVRENSGGWVQVSLRRYAGLAMFNNVRIRALNAQPVLFFNKPASVSDPLQVDSYSYRLNESFSPTDYATELAANTAPMLTIVGADDEALIAEAFTSLFTQYAPEAALHLLPAVKHLDLVSNAETARQVGLWLAEAAAN